MPLDLDENNALYQIRSYRPGCVEINDKAYTQSVIITPDQLIDFFSPQTISELTAESLTQITALKPDILIIGTGHQHTLISPSVYGELINQGIGVEVMSTGAACRTFNALSAENRRVAAILLL